MKTKKENKIVLEKGLSTKVIEKISALKNEPKWMLDIRLNAYKAFLKLRNPKWGPDLNFINFDEYIYYASSIGSKYYKTSWDEVPEKIKEQFQKLNILENEAKYFSGVNNQYDSDTVYHQLKYELKSKNVIFTNIETAIDKYPNLVKKYFGKLVPFSDNKYAALNTAVWSGGTFLYVPKGVKLDQPLSAYFRINTKSVGQFERTLIIVDDNAYVHYNEGCTAPNGIMEWIDGNLGSKLNMKYPATILKGDKSKGKCISIAVSHKGVIQDAGAKMIHIGRNTRSQIISKSIAHSGGNATYRGLVQISKSAVNSASEVVCDTLILDKISKSDTYPTEKVFNKSSVLKHEAKVTDLDKQKLFYLQSRGIDLATAKQLLVLGFIEDFSNELPLEYSVELNRLLKLDIK